MIALRLRELAGWVLLLLGLGLFGTVTYVLLEQRRPLEAIPLMIVAIFVFRGGLQLLKLALAARLVLAEARAEHREPRAVLTSVRGKKILGNAGHGSPS